MWRWGEEPDLPLPGLVTAGALSPDGRTCLPPEDEELQDGVVVWRFGPSLSPAFLEGRPAARLRRARRPADDPQPLTARSVSCGSPWASSGPRTAVKASVRTVRPSSARSTETVKGSSVP